MAARRSHWMPPARGGRGVAGELRRWSCFADEGRDGTRDDSVGDRMGRRRNAALFIASSYKKFHRGLPASSPGAYRREAVSYTHLRAHETPEHLVCRLLLEKK